MSDANETQGGNDELRERAQEIFQRHAAEKSGFDPVPMPAAWVIDAICEALTMNDQPKIKEPVKPIGDLEKTLVIAKAIHKDAMLNDGMAYLAREDCGTWKNRFDPLEYSDDALMVQAHFRVGVGVYPNSCEAKSWADAIEKRHDDVFIDAEPSAELIRRAIFECAYLVAKGGVK